MQTLIAVYLYLIVIVGFLIGWVMNIVKLFSVPFDPLSAELVLRIVGIPVGVIGAVYGWF